MAQNTLERISLDGQSLNLGHAWTIAHGAEVDVSDCCKKDVDKAQKLVHQIVEKGKPVYGINTGFGYFSRKRVPEESLKQLQVNILRSHASSHGKPFPPEVSRLAMALRLNVLLKGRTGVRWELCQQIQKLLSNNILPVIPECGSVGASGDLSPLAHLALPLIGEGQVTFGGQEMEAKKALSLCNIRPINLIEKEGLSLINGTQIMLSVGSLALHEALRLHRFASLITGLTYEGLEALTSPLYSSLHEVRRQTGQVEVARQIREALEGSYLWNHESEKVQDPYSLRCAPQIHGPSLDALHYAREIIERELNAVTDNPLVFSEEGRIVSGGNFHGQALAMALDIAGIALAEIGNVSERRTEQLLNPTLSGLPAFLTPEGGLNSGYMAAQYLAASMVNENKLSANPACTDSIPGNIGVEDHVSMGMTSAKKLQAIVDRSYGILAVELLCAAQAIHLKGKRQLGKETGPLYEALRKTVPPLEEDRIIAKDVEEAVKVLRSTHLNLH